MNCLQIDSLTVVDTAIPQIPANIFYGWTIIRLVLNRNTLSQIENGAFNGSGVAVFICF